MFPQLLDSTEAHDIARAMRDGFNRHYRLFRTGSARARHRFETADWQGQQRAPRERNEEKMSGEVWYPVGPKDVFPYEQQKRFAVLHGPAHTG